MIEGRLEKIKAGQHLFSYELEGKAIPRIRYGDEQEDWK
jgi:hypothetical protein